MSEKYGSDNSSEILLPPGIIPGGSSRFGRWYEDFIPRDINIDPYYLPWFEKAIELASDDPAVRFLDAGCGNGAIGVPYAEMLANSGKEVEAYLVDIAPDGIQSLRDKLETRTVPENLKIYPRVADLTELTKHIPKNSVHWIICKWVLHWLPELKMGETMRQFNEILVPGGIAVVKSCSYLNQLGVGRRSRDGRLETALQKSNYGTLPHAYEVFNHNHGKMVHLLTEPLVQKLVSEVGLELCDLDSYKFPPDDMGSNGYGEEYKEGIRFIIRKPT